MTIPHHFQTTFVLGTAFSARLECLAGEQLLSEGWGVGGSASKSRVNSNNSSPFSAGFYSPLFQLPDSELNGNLSKLFFPQTLWSPRQSVRRVTTGISDCQLKLNGHLITICRGNEISYNHRLVNKLMKLWLIQIQFSLVRFHS